MDRGDHSPCNLCQANRKYILRLAPRHHSRHLLCTCTFRCKRWALKVVHLEEVKEVVETLAMDAAEALVDTQVGHSVKGVGMDTQVGHWVKGVGMELVEGDVKAAHWDSVLPDAVYLQALPVGTLVMVVQGVGVVQLAVETWARQRRE